MTDDLQLDHFAIPKNEGGNFLLFDSKTRTLRLNVVVLCRSCNSAKGERSYVEFFGPEALARLNVIHGSLLKAILSNTEALRVVRKWYEIPYSLLPDPVSGVDSS